MRGEAWRPEQSATSRVVEYFPRRLPVSASAAAYNRFTCPNPRQLAPPHPQMEPMRSSPQPQPRMVAKKSPPNAAVDAVAAAAESPLNGLFYPPSHVSREQELYAILSKGQNGSAQAGITDSKSQWSPTKSHTPYTKDNKHSHTYDSGDTSIFGSSLHYGGRDYYASSAPKQATGTNDSKVDKKDPTTDSHGDWWQGSFYY